MAKPCGRDMVAGDCWSYDSLTTCYVTLDFELTGTKFPPIWVSFE